MHLMDLPAELRIIIFKNVFHNVSVRPIEPHVANESWKLRIMPFASLMFVNKAVHRESYNLFWDSVFLDVDTTSFVAWQMLYPGEEWKRKTTIKNVRISLMLVWHAVNLGEMPPFIAELRRSGPTTLLLTHPMYPIWGADEATRQMAMPKFLWSLVSKFMLVAKNMPHAKELLLELRLMAADCVDIDLIQDSVKQTDPTDIGSVTFMGLKDASRTAHYDVSGRTPCGIAVLKFHSHRAES